MEPALILSELAFHTSLPLKELRSHKGACMFLFILYDLAPYKERRRGEEQKKIGGGES